MRACQICLSPYRRELVEAFNNGIPRKRIYDKYAPKMEYKASPSSFYLAIRKHVLGKHKCLGIYVPTASSEETGRNRPVDIETFGQRMLELGMAKVDNMDPESVKITEVISAQRLVLDSKKLKLTEDAMQLMMTKMFGPPQEVINGELVNDITQLGSGENGGDKPPNL